MASFSGLTEIHCGPTIFICRTILDFLSLIRHITTLVFTYNKDNTNTSRIYLRQYIVLVVLQEFRYSMSADHYMGLKTTLGTNIRRQRKERNLSQQKLAVYVDISITHLRAIEHGTTNTTVDVVERFANFFGVEPYTLFIDSVAETKSA